jgi:hypothetical protein
VRRGEVAAEDGGPVEHGPAHVALVRAGARAGTDFMKSVVNRNLRTRT